MKPKIIIGIVIIVAAFIYLIAGSFQQSSVYYVTVSELHAAGNIGTTGLRVSGIVDPDQIHWDAENIECRFPLTESGDTLWVVYRNMIPDQLAAAQQVVVEGRLADDGLFQADKILLKCPSKYESKKMDI